MKIKTVKRIKDEELGMDGLEVTIEDNGKEFIECFVDAEEALQKENNGKERFMNQIIENKKNKNKPIIIGEKSLSNLNKFEGREL